MKNIDFFTFITETSIPFANFLFTTGELLKSQKHNIHWKCILSKKAKKSPENFKTVCKNKDKSSNPSMRHAYAIKDAINYSVNDYIIIADVDIAITYKNWDDEIIKILDNGFSCFGSPNSSNKYGETDFPNVPFFAFKKDILKKVNLDFRPILNNKNLIHRISLESKEKIEAKGRGIGDTIFFETGCRLSSEFEKANLKNKCFCLKVVHPEKKDSQLKIFNFKQKIEYTKLKFKYKRLYHNHFIEYHYNNKLFLTHLGNSHNSKLTNQNKWKKAIEKYINNFNYT